MPLQTGGAFHSAGRIRSDPVAELARLEWLTALLVLGGAASASSTDVVLLESPAASIILREMLASCQYTCGRGLRGRESTKNTPLLSPLGKCENNGDEYLPMWLGRPSDEASAGTAQNDAGLAQNAAPRPAKRRNIGQKLQAHHARFKYSSRDIIREKRADMDKKRENTYEITYNRSVTRTIDVI